MQSSKVMYSTMITLELLLFTLLEIKRKRAKIRQSFTVNGDKLSPFQLALLIYNLLLVVKNIVRLPHRHLLSIITERLVSLARTDG